MSRDLSLIRNIGIAAPPDVHGRPCGVTMLPDGSLLVMDDAADTIWRVSAAR